VSKRARALEIGLWVLAVLAFLFAIARLIGIERGFVPVVVVSYTPYAAVITVIVLFAALALREWGPAVPAAIAAGVLLVLISPRALQDQERADPGGPHITAMAANALFGRSDPGQLVDLVDDDSVDLLAVEELTPGLARDLSQAGVEDSLPYSVLMPAPGAGGAGLYSANPVAALEPVPAQVHGMRTPRATVSVEGAEPIEVSVAHPHPPLGPETMRAWQVGLASLPEADPGGTVRVVLGDFNATLDHAELRRLIDTGYRDAADVAGTGLLPTWPSGLFPPPVTIDHVLVDERVGVDGLVTRPLTGSDHLAVQAELRLPGPG
jgi:endonuclease/exonuclease/phosphatase family metal-dependent hydrolase